MRIGVFNCNDLPPSHLVINRTCTTTFASSDPTLLELFKQFEEIKASIVQKLKPHVDAPSIDQGSADVINEYLIKVNEITYCITVWPE